MNNKLAMAGKIAAVVSAVGLGVGSIVAECRRHRAENELYWAKFTLALRGMESCLKDARIKKLEEENQKLKSNCQTEES